MSVSIFQTAAGIFREEGALLFVLLFADEHQADVPVLAAHGADLEDVQRLDERRQLFEAVIAHVEIRIPLGEDIPDIPEGSPPVVVGGLLHDGQHGVPHGVERRVVKARKALRRGRGLAGGAFGRGVLRGEDLEILELVAGGDEGAGGLLFAHAHHDHAGFPQARGEAREVAVARDDAEPVDVAGIQDVHRVDDHRGIRRVLARRVAVLLDGRDGIVEQDVFPGGHRRPRPVAVDPLDGRHAVVRDLVQDELDIFFGHVIRVDQHGETLFVRHNSTSFSFLQRSFPLCAGPVGRHGRLREQVGPVGVAGIGRHELVDDLHHLPVVDAGGLAEGFDIAEEGLLVERDGVADVDQLVQSLFAAALAVEQQLLVQFFARAQAGILDLDVLVRLIAGKADQVARKVDDLDRPAHVEDEDLAALRHAAGLDDEAGGLRDRHEIPHDVRVRDGDGPALGDLLLEKRNHAAVAAQHVAEAHGDEAGLAVAAVILHDQLADALGRAHDVRGVHGLVGGDQHHAPHMVAVARLRDVQRAEHVVLHGLAGVQLHQRHVLVRGGVEDHVRPQARKDAVDPPAVAHRADHHFHVQPREAAQQLVLELVGVVLVDFEHNQLAGMEAGDLAAELAADGAAAARDEDHPVAQIAADLLDVQPNLVPAQQVENAHVADPQGLRAAVEDLIQGGDGFQSAVRFRADLEDLPLVLLFGRRNGEDDLVDVVPRGDAGDAFPAARHLDAVDARAALLFIVVDRDDRDPLRLGCALEVLDDHGAHLAGADDHDPAGFARAPHAGAPALQAADEADGEPGAAHQEQRQQPAHHIDGDREPLDVVSLGIVQHAGEDRVAQDGHDQAGRGGAVEDLEQLVQAGELPHGAVKAEQRENGDAHQRHPRDAGAEGLDIVKGDPVFRQKAEHKGQPVAEKDTENVDHDLRGQIPQAVSSVRHTITPMRIYLNRFSIAQTGYKINSLFPPPGFSDGRFRGDSAFSGRFSVSCSKKCGCGYAERSTAARRSFLSRRDHSSSSPLIGMERPGFFSVSF